MPSMYRLAANVKGSFKRLSPPVHTTLKPRPHGGLMNLSQVLQRAVRYFNPIAKAILASRLHPLLSSRLMLLTFTGRKTGRSRTTPVSYVLDGSSLLVPGGGAWSKNLGAGRPAQVCIRGTWIAVEPELVAEPLAMEELLRLMLAANPTMGMFTGIRPGPDGRPYAAALERERGRGFVVVRLRPETISSTASSSALGSAAPAFRG
ncbi:MAG: nitroreductase family deazaflavin-dependent oxidoreductase [Chloroflexi bacterium]|nr:MAG: nitroreductase family deazaflavin-dependent oxidoreductase [Chloroflexota bacterium]